MRSAGVDAQCQREDSEEEILLTIRIPRQRSGQAEQHPFAQPRQRGGQVHGGSGVTLCGPPASP